MKLYMDDPKGERSIIEHLESRLDEVHVSRKEWVDKAQASEKECQRLFEINESLIKKNAWLSECLKRFDYTKGVEVQDEGADKE